MKGGIGLSLAGAFIGAGVLLFSNQVPAHHSIAGEFDTTVEFELRGTLTELEWANPHLWYYLDVTNQAGEVEKWQCTTGLNPNRLIRAGWRKEDLPVGSKLYIARAHPAHLDENTCIVMGNLALDDGTPVFSGRKGEQGD